MATKNLHLRTSGGGSYYARVFALSGADAGKVLDFSDNTFKALASATTPYIAATEQSTMDGTGFSAYLVALDLSEVNSLAIDKEFVVHWYQGAAPADTDVSVEREEPFIVAISKEGRREWVVQCELGVKSTAGSTAQLSVWLEHDGQKVDIDGVDATPTMSTVVREHAAGSPLFTATGAVSDVTNDIFEVEQSSPGFTDDRLYEVTPTITVNSTAYATTHVRGVIG